MGCAALRPGNDGSRRALGKPVSTRINCMKKLIRGAHVLTLDEHDSEYPCADILIDGDKIAAIGAGPLQNAADADQVIDAAGKLAMPGLINGHFHSQANLLVGAL